MSSKPLAYRSFAATVPLAAPDPSALSMTVDCDMIGRPSATNDGSTKWIFQVPRKSLGGNVGDVVVSTLNHPELCKRSTKPSRYALVAVHYDNAHENAGRNTPDTSCLCTSHLHLLDDVGLRPEPILLGRPRLTASSDSRTDLPTKFA